MYIASPHVERKFVANVQITGASKCLTNVINVTNCNNVTNVITGASKDKMATELFSCPVIRALPQTITSLVFK